jgi:putative sterol carrier protein
MCAQSCCFATVLNFPELRIVKNRHSDSSADFWERKSMIPADIFAKLPEDFNPDKAAGIDMALVFSLSGNNGGDWTIVIAEGAVEVTEGVADDPTSTINMDSDDFVKMMSGQLNPMKAFMSGKAKVDGDLNSVMKMLSAFGV